ncbi:E3 ubiquitin-protein ligase RMA3 [Apostasia shenzhenica]|uniref:E3 ubiquitin-protein ligase RMA n=1 Tax=Apostasia shenzhenica TaxID=1088818 RepID=A0A2I0ATF9_9ASPA|nr:E3 ubiquitin-protein ligase RMA3 [Apostasia shenzhenica]
MADEGHEGRPGRMDLNLYLGRPRPPRSRSLDLGSDLALSSLPSSSFSEESRSSAAAFDAMEASASRTPRSPSNAPDAAADVPPDGLRTPPDANPDYEYPPCLPLFESYVQETEARSGPYSPYNAPSVLIDEQVVVEADEGVRVFAASLNELSPFNIADSSAQGDGDHLQYSPSYSPGSATLQDEETFVSLPSVPLRIGGDFSSSGDLSSSQHELLQSPEFGIQRSFESEQWRFRRLRSSFAYGGERPNFARRVSPGPVDLMPDTMVSLRSLDNNGKHKVNTESLSDEGSEEDIKLKDGKSASFECNICLDMANEPVVTCCGHLFCWPCLYQWLHVHSDHKECPVCKGEVTDVNIIPIYGRGVAGPDTKSKDREDKDFGVEIPPRPHGNRQESWRQHFRPISQRFGEGITTWRRLLNQQLRFRNRFEGQEAAFVQEVLNGGPHSVLTRSNARLLRREVGATGRATDTQPMSSALLSSNVVDPWNRFYGFADTSRFATITTDIGRAVGRYAGSSIIYGASSSSVNARNDDHIFSRGNIGVTAAGDQASASSTVAMIQGEIPSRDTLADPNAAGSSRPNRRLRSNGAFCSSDVDGGTLHARKRRRLN